MIILAADPLEHVLPHPIFGHHLMWFTNQSVMALVSALLMLLIFPKLFPKPDSSAPSGTKNFFEAILEFLRIEVFRPALKEHTDKFVPFLWTVFFFILFCNVLGCIPLDAVVGILTGGHVEHVVGGTATGSISTCATLAVIAFFFIHFHGIDTLARTLMEGTYGTHGHHQEHTSNGSPPHEAAHDLEHLRAEGLPADVPGDLDALRDPVAHYHDDEYPHKSHEQAAVEFFDERHNKMTPGWAVLLAVPIYLWNFAPHPFRPQKGESQFKWLLDLPMFGILLVLELIGALIKPFALCMRLFANMVAGHAVLAVLVSLIVAMPTILGQVEIGIPAGFMDICIQALELFVAVLQAYIFTFLVTLFLASAVAPEH
jgi:F0F1-type ATP synthase membrane subunit a